FQDRLTIGPGHNRPERHFDSRHLAIIGIVHLNRNGADRSVGIAQLSDQKSGFIIEEQFDAGSAGSSSLYDRDLLVFDRSNRKTRAPVREGLFDCSREPEI